MIIYNLGDEDKELTELALTTLLQIHDQVKGTDPARIKYLREKFRRATTIYLVTEVTKNRPLHDEA